MALPLLNILRVFEAAARHDNFVCVAQGLHIMHDAVSRQVQQLETSLGVDLFERRNRAAFPTPAGDQLHAATIDALEILTGNISRIACRAISPTLVISCKPALAMRWLTPRLPCFQAWHSAVQAYLFVAGGPIDFACTGVNVALRHDDFAWPAYVHAAPICGRWIGPVYTRQADTATRRRLSYTVTRLNT